MNTVSIGSIRAEGQRPRYFVVKCRKIVAHQLTRDMATTLARELCESMGYVAYRGIR